MDISSLKVTAEKLHKQLTQYCKPGKKVYSKTEKKLYQIREELHESLSMIDSFLEYKEDNYDEPEEITPTEEVISMREYNNLSTRDRKFILYKYGQVLKHTSKQISDYEYVSQCASLIWTWFDHRFYRAKNPMFRYKITNIPIWISYIIVAYGKHARDGTEDEFVNHFRMWCNKLSEDKNEVYALPYDVYELGSQMDVIDASLEAISIWDCLFDSGYIELNDKSLKCCRINEEYMYTLIESLNPDLVKNYIHYTEDDKILRKET